MNQSGTATWQRAVELADAYGLSGLSPFPAFDWQSQAVQYPRLGVPGTVLEQHWVDTRTGQEVQQPVGTPSHITRIDCLLHREPDGSLSGILNHYNENCPLEQSGAVNIWVRPDRQRSGIATSLVMAANALWSLRVDDQRCTVDGVMLVAHVARILGIEPRSTDD